MSWLADGATAQFTEQLNVVGLERIRHLNAIRRGLRYSQRSASAGGGEQEHGTRAAVSRKRWRELTGGAVASTPPAAMPSASLFAVIDDIATLLDDVALLTKVATKKTVGVLGDDLALNAQQVAGVTADRELPVVWAVAKGSLVNKAILVPAALTISGLAPWAITPLLMAGGVFLCFEGVEKLAHKLLHGKAEQAVEHSRRLQAVADTQVDMVMFERDKIKGAIRTDLILSAEIVTIALGTVATAPFGTRLAVLSGLSLLMTIGVYGLVAGIVKLDDAGLLLKRRAASGPAGLAPIQAGLGTAILLAAPWLMKSLSLAGTVAMFLVGGGILAHAVPELHALVHDRAESSRSIRGIGPVLAAILPSIVDFLVGMFAGVAALAAWTGVKRLKPRQ
jgi:predicted DNA repair protein MutK